MHMILCSFSTDDFHIVFTAYLSDQIAYRDYHFSCQYPFAILGDEHHVNLQIVFGMRCGAVMLHRPLFLSLGPGIKLKSPPKKRGIFSPSPIVTLITSRLCDILCDRHYSLKLDSPLFQYVTKYLQQHSSTAKAVKLCSSLDFLSYFFS